MQQQETKYNIFRSTCVFLVFLLLGGLVHFFDRKDYAHVPDTLIYCVSFTIYASLILYWIQMVRDRLTRSPSRGYTLAAGVMMLLYLLIRTMKYRIAVTPIEDRAFWHLYYVPMIMMPTLFLMTCVRFHAGRESRPWELLLLIPAALQCDMDGTHVTLQKQQDGFLRLTAAFPSAALQTFYFTLAYELNTEDELE